MSVFIIIFSIKLKWYFRIVAVNISNDSALVAFVAVGFVCIVSPISYCHCGGSWSSNCVSFRFASSHDKTSPDQYVVLDIFPFLNSNRDNQSFYYKNLTVASQSFDAQCSAAFSILMVKLFFPCKDLIGTVPYQKLNTSVVSCHTLAWVETPLRGKYITAFDGPSSFYCINTHVSGILPASESNLNRP